MYNTFFLPNEKGVRLLGHDSLMDPDHIWTLGERLVFNTWFKKWLKARRHSSPIVEEVEKRVVDLNAPLVGVDWDMYAKLSHDDGVRVLNKDERRSLDEFRERIKRTRSNGRSELT